jgi:hypothetical protein
VHIGKKFNHPIWMNEIKVLSNSFNFSLHMLYKWQCVIGGIVVANNGD